jgi:hypothetical protein
MRAADAAMPGSWSTLSPFLQRLAGLRQDQKAAAVNLGIFPDSGDIASANVPNYSGAPALILSANGDIVPPVAQVSRPAVSTFAAAPVQVAYAAPVQKRQVQPSAASAPVTRKIWLQLASGSNPAALPDQFNKLKSRNRDLFDGISGYVARSPERARLVIGPFRGASDAQIFQEDLQSVGIDAFSWTNSDSDQIVPLSTE